MDCAQFAFDCIGELEKAKTPSAVHLIMARAASEFGVDRFLTAGLPATAKNCAPYVLMHNWPTKWLDRYTSEDYAEVDPVMQKIRSSIMPFAWDDARYDRHKNPYAHRVMGEARDFGLKSGFSVPIYTVSGDQAGVTFGGDEFQNTVGARRALHLIAIYGHSKTLELSFTRQSGRPALSPREIEVLKWCSSGKTNVAIAEILTLSENTIETHIASACRKLDAVNRTQAVALAIRARIIP